ncbi:MAG: hypothetical protein E7603_02485 [Ruminococcaceae bacterium]|nr:hypothetical protein [Oscillospiraceae bacterium]
MKKIAIVYPRNLNELRKRALEILSSTVLDYTKEYPVCVSDDRAEGLSDFRRIYIGTKESNAYIAENSKGTLTASEEYFILVENDTVIIEGFDDAGALYGAVDFYDRYILSNEYPDNPDIYRINFFERANLPNFEFRSKPSVAERGLWTWGHVIYDYKGYLDHMMMLKMNRVIIWNDFLPVNAREITEYAHARNIKVIWGFAWLWDTDCAKFDMTALRGESVKVFEKFEKEFGDTELDGIYFQTFTELNREHIDGVLIAEAAADFVNRTAKLFYEKYPNIELEFGLHANSVKKRLEFISAVDSRIRIVWENCGSFPFSYIPNDVKDFDETMEFVRKIASLRGSNDRFGVVTKGLVKLDWSCFEHCAGAQYIGVSTGRMKHDRVDRKAPIWKYIQANWIAYAHKALEAVRVMRDCKQGDLIVYALVEDGMFEENLMWPVALYAQMLWDCDEALPSLMSRVALRSNVAFA